MTTWKRLKTTKSQRKRQRRKESEKQLRHNRWKDDRKKKRQMKGLHPAAKMKRILSYCDYLFSRGNLRDDAFYRSELADYKGHVRISAIASGRKLEHWADDEGLIVDALGSEAARGRYRVVFNREFVERVARNRKRQEMRRAEERRRDRKTEKEQRRRRARRRMELKRFVDRIRTEFWRRRLEEIVAQDNEEMEVEMEKERSLQASRMSWTERVVHRVSTKFDDAKEWISTVTSRDQGGIDDEPLDWDRYYMEDFEEELVEENPEFEEALHELEEINYKIRHGNKVSNIIGDVLPNERERDLKMIANEGNVDLRIKADDYENDEELPLPIVDDGSTDCSFALVRPKKVKQGDYTFDSGTEYDDGDESQFLADDYIDPQSEEPNLEAYGVEKKKKQTRKNLKKYSSERDIRVIKNAEELKSFCHDLKESLGTNNAGESDAGDDPAIGFDVEYCSLEMDIRMTLPAMLQLASSDPKGPVGLIWLDKFPNHGKDMIGDADCEALISILSTSGISKVGVGVSKDAKHLAAWWGITDKQDVGYYLSGIVDLEDDWDDRINKKSLQEMCESVL